MGYIIRQLQRGYTTTATDSTGFLTGFLAAG